MPSSTSRPSDWPRSARTRPGCWPRRVRRVSGGKRFRAAFCYWGYHAVAGTSFDGRRTTRWCGPVPRSSCSMRAHSCTTTTWTPPTPDVAGRPHTAASRPSTAQTGWRGDPEQYGASAAILLGDLLLSWSDELLRRCGLPIERVVAALDVFDRCRSEVITGQFLDVSVQARGVADVDAAMTVLRYKSAKYSIERPLHIGATLAGGSADQLARAERVRTPARGGLPAARRPARGLRRPVRHREAGRRRPRRGEADRARRPGPGRRTGCGRRTARQRRSARH